jgi:hypothetical protein
MSKFTPGPWLVGDYDKLTILTANRALRIASADFQTRQCVANAKLIAAAPDLLEALAKATEFLDANYSNADMPDILPACRSALENAKSPVSDIRGIEVGMLTQREGEFE